MDYFNLLVSLPHHGEMGKFQNDRSVPPWEATHGSRWTTEDLLTCAAELEGRAGANQGVEWGDTRARAINWASAGFLRRAAELRSR
jgi:hypothetical protein